jgi:tRNA threonylcarbamoyladenosine modification (KEOPS) complex  Pcc1 subunit
MPSPFGVMTLGKSNARIGVMVSAQDYDAMRAFYANRLQHTLAASAAQSEKAGMTAKRLEALLRDES